MRFYHDFILVSDAGEKWWAIIIRVIPILWIGSPLCFAVWHAQQLYGSAMAMAGQHYGDIGFCLHKYFLVWQLASNAAAIHGQYYGNAVFYFKVLKNSPNNAGSKQC